MSEAPRGTRPVVLLVEDDEDNQKIYRDALEFVGVRVVQAWDGEEGVRMAREHLPHAILMDIALPRLNGWQATERLRGDPATAHIPVLALTAYALPQDRQRAMQAGYAAYLVKPIAPREVVAEVRRVLGAHGTTWGDAWDTER
jgi:two-component system cell cycle response regulator DivK